MVAIAEASVYVPPICANCAAVMVVCEAENGNSPASATVELLHP